METCHESRHHRTKAATTVHCFAAYQGRSTLRRRIARQMLIDHYLDLTIDIARRSSQTLQATRRRLAARWHETE
jgi:hypothetical protein